MNGVVRADMYQTRHDTIWKGVLALSALRLPLSRLPADPDLARRVAGVLAYAGYNRDSGAAILGIKADQLRKYLRGRVEFSQPQLEAIAKACDVSLRLLYEDWPSYDASSEPPGEIGRDLRG